MIFVSDIEYVLCIVFVFAFDFPFRMCHMPPFLIWFNFCTICFFPIQFVYFAFLSKNTYEFVWCWFLDFVEKKITGDILGNFVQRVTTQLNHIRHLLRTIFDVVSTHQIPTKGELTRDAFGLHTIIVVLTTSGKVNNKM